MGMSQQRTKAIRILRHAFSLQKQGFPLRFFYVSREAVVKFIRNFYELFTGLIMCPQRHKIRPAESSGIIIADTNPDYLLNYPPALLGGNKKYNQPCITLFPHPRFF